MKPALTYLLLGLAVLALTSCSFPRQQNPIDAAIEQDCVDDIRAHRNQ